MPITSTDMATFVCHASVGENVLSAAATAILDTIGVLIAGSMEEATTRIAETLAPQLVGVPSFNPNSLVRGADAALLYGTAAHALDFDDVSMLAICHPSASVLAALLASGKWSELDGPRLCEAHAIGTEVMIRMGQAIGFHHYELGFHSTATMGVFGATAAVARLRRLNPIKTANALAIAASLACGLRMNFGSMTKPVHVGVAAANAIRAVEWACAGVTAHEGDLFGQGGVFEAFSGGSQAKWPEDVPLGAPFAIEVPGFERKNYACCYLLHKIIALGKEASLEGVKLGNISKFRVEVPLGGTRPLIHQFPKSGDEAKFSGPYALVAALHDGEITFESFGDRAVSRRIVQERLADVSVAEAAGPTLTAEEIGAAPVRLELLMTDGSKRHYERSAAPGSPADPMTPHDLKVKWIDCLQRANRAVSTESAAELHERGVSGLKSAELESWLQDVWAVTGSRATPPLRIASC